MVQKICGGGGIARLTAVLLAAFAILLSLSPAALAATNGGGNTAYVTTGDISDQTIVGEGQNNNVTITNTTSDSPSPTGILMANLPILVIGAFVVAGAVVVIARAKKKAGEDDE